MRSDEIHRTGAAGIILAAALCLGLDAWTSGNASFRADIRDHDAREILERVDKMMSADSTSGTLVMNIHATHWNRSLSVRFWTKDDDKFLMRILSPKKERDTATLRFGSDIWNYLPKTDRIIKVPPASQASSWMGSHFTYSDLLQDSALADQYTYEVTDENYTEDGLLVEITCVPKPDVPVVWGKVRVIVNRKDDLPVAIRYYDEDDRPVRTLEFLDVGFIGGRRIPRRQRMTPEDKPNEHTEVIYEDLVFDPVLDDGMFSFRGLKR